MTETQRRELANGCAKTTRRKRSTSRSPQPAAARWTELADDTASVDRDIEVTLALLQARHGYTRSTANSELVRMLSLSSVA